MAQVLDVERVPEGAQRGLLEGFALSGMGVDRACDIF